MSEQLKKTAWTAKHVQDVLDNFDFHKVERVMDMLNWRWQSATTPPLRSELIAQARSLLTGAMDRYLAGPELTGCTQACGGFSATVDAHTMGASFDVTGWSIDAEDVFPQEPSS